MRYEVIPTSYFLRRLKQLKGRGIERGIDSLALSLQEVVFPGVVIKDTKGKVRKARVGADDRGKRGSFRAIYYLCVEEAREVYLIDVYGKNEKETVTPTEIKQLLKQQGLPLVVNYNPSILGAYQREGEQKFAFCRLNSRTLCRENGKLKGGILY